LQNLKTLDSKDVLVETLREAVPLADYQEVAARISEALKTASECSRTGTLENYSLLQEQLEELESATKNSLRANVDYRPLVAKLEQGTPLSDAELSMLRSLIVGDAEQYLKYDESFNRAKEELEKLIEEIQALDTTDLTADSLMKLRVLCQDASIALAPTLHYIEQKDRVTKFQQHTNGPLSRDAGHILAGIIKENLAD